MAVGTVASSSRQDQAKDQAKMATEASKAKFIEKQYSKSAEEKKATSNNHTTAQGVTTATNRGAESYRSASAKTAAGPGGALSGSSGVGGTISVRA